MRRTGIDQSLGCLSVLPAAMIGFAGLTDGVGPTGWQGLAELFGWFVACLVAAKLLALLLGRGRQAGTLAYALGMVAVAVTGALAYEVLNWLGLDAPMSEKITFTSSMQAVGALAAGPSVLLIAHAVWTSKRR